MFFQHAVLALLKNSENKGIILFLYQIVPICPALFLFIAGYSINISFKNKLDHQKNSFFIHLVKKGIILILASIILFFIEYGFQFPDLIISSGILNTIGWMIIISAIILRFKYKEITLSLLIILIIFITIIFEKYNIYLVPFNYGYEPISPTIIFGFIGLGIGIFLNTIKNNENKKRVFILTLLIIGIFIFTFFSIKHGVFRIFYDYIGRYDAKRVFNNAYTPLNFFKLNKNDSFFYKYIWNYKMNCFFASLGIVFILFSCMFFLEKFFQKYLSKKIFLPGQFAFFNYFYHLSIIALSVIIFGYNNFSTVTFILFLGALYITSYLLSFFY